MNQKNHIVKMAISKTFLMGAKVLPSVRSFHLVTEVKTHSGLFPPAQHGTCIGEHTYIAILTVRVNTKACMIS